MAKGAPPGKDDFADHRFLPRDSVERLIRDWESTRPDLDFSAVAVISRLGRVRAHIDREVEGLFGRFGITGPGFAVLVTLARLEATGVVSQRRLMDELGLTPGTVSVRIDKLAAAGLVTRRAGEDDRRSTNLALTEAGRELFERIVPAHLENEKRLLSALSDAERTLLANLLNKLLVEFEGSGPASGAPCRLGLELAPAHVAIAMRAAVGLSPVAALLVRGVSEGGVGAAAGIQVGDLLKESDGRALTSVAALHAATSSARGRVPLRIVRGAHELVVELDLDAPQGGESAAPPVRAARGIREEHAV